LDPFAEGVLVICLGHACRLVDLIQAQPKVYRAGIVLGATSTTDDCMGQITPTKKATAPTLEAVKDALALQTGKILQVPPAHSAVHVDGQRAYKLAREGKPMDLTPKPVQISRIDILNYAFPCLEVEIACGSGTYIRAIARDVGKTLGVGGFCHNLVRTAVGGFTLDKSVKIEQADLARDMIGPLEALPDFPRITLMGNDLKIVRLGQALKLGKPTPHKELAVLDGTGTVVAVATAEEEGWTLQPRRVFAPVEGWTDK
jgi:tRNA pseudouridine55 synthase